MLQTLRWLLCTSVARQSSSPRRNALDRARVHNKFSIIISVLLILLLLLLNTISASHTIAEALLEIQSRPTSTDLPYPRCSPCNRDLFRFCFSSKRNRDQNAQNALYIPTIITHSNNSNSFYIRFEY